MAVVAVAVSCTCIIHHLVLLFLTLDLEVPSSSNSSNIRVAGTTAILVASLRKDLRCPLAMKGKPVLPPLDMQSEGSSSNSNKGATGKAETQARRAAVAVAVAALPLEITFRSVSDRIRGIPGRRRMALLSPRRTKRRRLR